MTGHPTVETPNLATYARHPSLLVQRAYVVLIDGEARHPRSAIRSMFEVFEDGVGLGGSTFRCTADRPPIDEAAWLNQGRIRDITGADYASNGTPRTSGGTR